MVLDTTGTRLHYVPGDHVAIYPQNNSKLVSELLERLSLPCKPDEPIFVECRREPSIGGLATWSEERRLPVPVTIREAFSNYLDITNPPTPQFLKLLAQQATKVTDQLEIMELAKGGNKYEDWKYERFPNMIDVMNQFHSLKINVTLLLQQLPLLQCVSGTPSPFLLSSLPSYMYILLFLSPHLSLPPLIPPSPLPLLTLPPLSATIPSAPLPRCILMRSMPQLLLSPSEREVHLEIISLVAQLLASFCFSCLGGTGPRHHGICSTWLNRIEPGTIVPCFIRK